MPLLTAQLSQEEKPVLNPDLVQQYEAALAARDLGYAHCQRHLENISALESELADKRETMERLDHQLLRITDPDEGQRLKREFHECRERSILLETAIKNLQNKTNRLFTDARELGEKCSRHHQAIIEAEYQRIAATVAHEAAELFALAKATLQSNPLYGYGSGGNLLGAFPYLAKVDPDPIFAAIADRLGIPVKIPRAINPTV